MDRRKSLLEWAAGATSLIYVLFCFVPWNPPQNYGPIESSWMMALHAAFHERLQFGSDIVFSFGPWGFLYGGYYPATHFVATFTWSLLGVVFWWIAWRSARHFFANELVSWLWLMAVIATTNTTNFLNIDVRLTACVLLLLLRHFFVEDRAFSVNEAALVVSLGLLSLIKFSLMVHATVIVSAVALDLILRQRRFPWPVPLYGVSLLAFWILAGQRLSSIGPYVTNSLHVAGGFTEAMALSVPTEVRDICLFLAAATLLLILAGYAAWLRHKFVGTLFVMGWGFGLFTAYKYGYVRHDAHEVAAGQQLVLMSLFCLALLWARARKAGRSHVVAILMLPLAIGAFAASSYARHVGEGWRAYPVATGSLDGRRKSLHDAYEEHLAGVRNAMPLPAIAGTMDAYPWNQASIFAYGLPLRSRPVIQSYATFDPALAELNAAFLRSDAAPENILFRVETVDDRYPSLDDGRSWPELITRYDLHDVEEPFVLLKRSSSPRQFRLIPLGQFPLEFGERLDVPATDAGPVWAEIEMSRTAVGSVVSALYKPPELRFHVTVRDGRQIDKRLVPGMTKSGFLLSPLVEDTASFAALAAAQARGDLADHEVTALSVTVAGTSSATAHYRNPMSVRFYRLEYPDQDVASVRGFRKLAHLRSAFRSAKVLQADRVPALIYSPDTGTTLDVPRRSAILLRPPQGARRLKLEFGIREADGKSPPATTGVSFQLSYMNEQGLPVALWTQRVDSTTRTDDQRTQDVTVDLPGTPSPDLILRTLPVDDDPSDTTTGFWSDVEFE